jgi:hypothetical protein
MPVPALQSLTGKYRDLQGNPVMKTETLNENRGFPVMKTGFPC